MTLCEIGRGDSPLVVDIPHAGTYVPDAIAARLTPAACAFPDTDWHVEKLFAFARDIGATLLVATHSRYVVDLNRNPSGRRCIQEPTIPSFVRRARSRASRSWRKATRRIPPK